MRLTQWRRKIGGGGNGTPQTFDGQVGAGSDDAFQSTADGVNLTGTTILVDSDVEHCGLRWTAVTVPGGATIDDVRVSVFINGGTFDEPIHQIRGELDANPGTFTTTTNDIDARSRTMNSAQWNSTNLGSGSNEEWEWGATTAGAGNGTNLKDMFQEIVDLGGWASGNAMVVIFEQHTVDVARDLKINAYEKTPLGTFAAKLHIEFTA